MKDLKRCCAVYEPLGQQCLNALDHSGPHACRHGEDMHLWTDPGDRSEPGEED